MPIRISLTVDHPEAASVITAAASTVTGVTDYESQALPPEANPAGRPAKVDNDIKYLKKFEDLTLCDILDELRPLIGSAYDDYEQKIYKTINQFCDLRFLDFIEVFKHPKEPSVLQSYHKLDDCDYQLVRDVQVGEILEKFDAVALEYRAASIDITKIPILAFLKQQPPAPSPADQPAKADEAINSNEKILETTISDFPKKVRSPNTSSRAQFDHKRGSLVKVGQFDSLDLLDLLELLEESGIFESVKSLGEDGRAFFASLKVDELVRMLEESARQDREASKAFEEFVKRLTFVGFVDQQHDAVLKNPHTRVNDICCERTKKPNPPPMSSLADLPPAGRDHYSDCETIEDFTVPDFVHHLNKLVKYHGRDSLSNRVEDNREIFDRLLTPFGELIFGQGRTFGHVYFVDFLSFAGVSRLSSSVQKLDPRAIRLLFRPKVCDLFEQLGVALWADVDAFVKIAVLDFLGPHDAQGSDQASSLTVLTKLSVNEDSKRLGDVASGVASSSGEKCVGHRRYALRPVCDPESPFQTLFDEEEADARAARQGAVDSAVGSERISNVARVASSEDGNDDDENNGEKKGRPIVTSWTEPAVLAGLLPAGGTLKAKDITDENDDGAVSLQETASDSGGKLIESVMRMAGIYENEDRDAIVHPCDQMTAPHGAMSADCASKKDGSADGLESYSFDWEVRFPFLNLAAITDANDRKWLMRKASLSNDKRSNGGEWGSLYSKDSIPFHIFSQVITDANDQERFATLIRMALLGADAEAIDDDEVSDDDDEVSDDDDEVSDDGEVGDDEVSDDGEVSDDEEDHDSQFRAVWDKQHKWLRELVAQQLAAHESDRLLEQQRAACLELEGSDDDDGHADARAQAAWDRLQGVSLELKGAGGGEHGLRVHLRVADAERAWLREVSTRLGASHRRNCELQRQLTTAGGTIVALHRTANKLRAFSSSSPAAAGGDALLQMELDGLQTELDAARTDVLTLQSQTMRAEGTWSGLLDLLYARERELDDAKAELEGLRRALESLRRAHVQLVEARQAAEREAADDGGMHD